jgi:hypothetical protein
MSQGPPPSEKTVGVYEMLWDCSYCGQKKNLGKTHRYCPSCGAPQDEDKRYFPTEAERVAVADHQFTGTDRVCPACATPQSAKAQNCGHCGSPLDGAKAAKLVTEPVAPAKPRSRRWLWILLAIVGVLALVIWWRCRTVEVGMQVTGHRWTTQVTVEEYREVEREAWDDQVPARARDVRCRSSQRGTREVEAPPSCRRVQRDNGDGTFSEVEQCTPQTRSEPVYDDLCSYTVEDWATVETLADHGGGLSPQYHQVRGIGGNGLGARREGGRRATYTLELTDGKKTSTCDVDEAVWRKYVDGQRIRVKVRKASGALVCSSL